MMKTKVAPEKPNLWPDFEQSAADVCTPENRFLAAANAGRNVFLTGMAGTGKSTLLRKFIADATAKVDVTAPTGVAALNVGGMTIHRFCGMRLGPQPGQTNEAFYRTLRDEKHPAIFAGFKRVRGCEILVIDEISMLPGRILDFVDFLFRIERGRDEPFGGAQVIATGDFLQLPPVKSASVAAISVSESYDWAFKASSWATAEFKPVVLETVRRQDEPQFVRALANFRRGRVWGEDARLLQSRIKNFPPANLTRLFTHNVQVEKWNRFQVEELPGETVTLEAETEGPEPQIEFLKKNLITPSRLELKPGAMVMFTINRNAPGKVCEGVYEPGPVLHVNGEMGVVQEIRPREGSITVRLRSGKFVGVTPFQWQFDRNDPASATLKQYPLRLAYAITIHKAQGLSLDAAYLDIRAAREPGQAYVAVSRVRTLAGLHFKAWFKGVHVSPEAIQFYESAQN
jgi:ATP-dependent DNA helicase PIF1